MALRQFTAALAAVAASCISVSAMAAPVVYNYSTSTFFSTSDTTLRALLGTTASVSGSFVYDASAPLTYRSEDIGYEPGLAIYSSGAVSQISGSVAGLSFIDRSNGTVSVGNDSSSTGTDWLTIIADPTPRPGQTTTPVGPSYPRQLEGFAIGDYTLHNVRLSWVEGQTTTQDFLADSSLPAVPPSFYAILALDFVLTADPTNLAGTPYYSHTVFFGGLTVQAAPVPEPTTGALALAGIAGLALVLRRRKA